MKLPPPAPMYKNNATVTDTEILAIAKGWTLSDIHSKAAIGTLIHEQ